MQTFSARLRVEVQRKGGPKAVSEASGVPLSTLNTYLAGSAEPKITAVIRLARTLGLSVSDLLDPASESWQPQSQTLRSGSQTEPEASLIPMLDVIASAGPGFENEAPRQLEALPFPRSLLRELSVSEKDARFLVARGDSMLPSIQDGAIVLIDSSFQRAKDDGIYVVVVGDAVRIKRIRLGWQGAIQLISDSEHYPNEQLAPPDAEALQIAGKVVWAGRKL